MGFYARPRTGANGQQLVGPDLDVCHLRPDVNPLTAQVSGQQAAGIKDLSYDHLGKLFGTRRYDLLAHAVESDGVSHLTCVHFGCMRSRNGQRTVVVIITEKHRYTAIGKHYRREKTA